MTKLKDEFLLEDSLIFLNHGSFGACPKPVFEVYQYWQRQLEYQPVRFLGRQATDLLAEARSELANYLNAPQDDLVYTPNPTTAINMIVRNLGLKPGDEILTSDHEYGAMDRTWRFICKKTGAKYVQRPISLPVSTQAEFVEYFLAGITPQTKVIFLSHITSLTALIFPVEEICKRAREKNIITIIDGAHAPGQISLDLEAINPDVYTGACHKWLCAPKGSAFLYAHPDIQPRLEPLVVSWGYESENPGPSQFIDYHEWQGTRDLAAFLAVPRAIQYQADNQWNSVRQRCHELALKAQSQIDSLTGLQAISPPSSQWFQQMVSVRLPPEIDPESLKNHLHDEYQIEVMALLWQDQPYLRVSFQAYNLETDLDALLTALEKYLSEEEFTHENN
ncbi:MAG: aminotransferase class V-fold PLP-dependent enzyme [Anaerolineales bacterium]|nr:aminotransferase class V-fold PLP-dependent enzyme [Anaerolineales bacterium]